MVVRYLVSSQKGGVGKTTTVANLAGAFSLAGNRVLVIDLDPQGCLGECFGISRTSGLRGVFDLYTMNRPVEGCIYHIDNSNIDIMPCNIASSLSEEALINASRSRSLLSQRLKPIEHQYDYIIIDTPPTMSNLTIVGMVTAERAIITLQPEPLSLSSCDAFLHMMWSVRESLNHRLGLEGILFTMYDRRARSSLQFIERVRQKVPTFVFATHIPRFVSLASAVTEGRPLTLLDPQAPGSRAYLELANELYARLHSNDISLFPDINKPQPVG